MIQIIQILRAANRKRHGTSSLWKNLQHVCPKDNPVKIRDKKQKTLCFQPKNEGDGEGGNLVPVKFNKEYIVLYELPFRHIEGEGFKQLIVSRTTVARDIFKMYLDEKAALRKILSKERMSITTDTWTIKEIQLGKKLRRALMIGAFRSSLRLRFTMPLLIILPLNF